MDNKLEYNSIYSNHLDRGEDVLYMCRDCGEEWVRKLLKDIEDTNYKNHKECTKYKEVVQGLE